jgi:hypothetical protein
VTDTLYRPGHEPARSRDSLRCWRCRRQRAVELIVRGEIGKNGRPQFLCQSCDQSVRVREAAEKQKLHKKPQEPREVFSDTRGTSPMSLGRVKLASEEARLATCPDCGYANGRHAKICRLAGVGPKRS